MAVDVIVSQFDLVDWVNMFAFIGLTVATYTILFYARALSATKEIGLNLFTLALGINLIGISHVFRIWLDLSTSPLIVITIAIGTMLLASGIIWVFRERKLYMSSLKVRSDQIKSVISKLKEKYYQQELSEGDLKVAYSQLLRELAEVEVQLDKMHGAKDTPLKTEQTQS